MLICYFTVIEFHSYNEHIRMVPEEFFETEFGCAIFFSCFNGKGVSNSNFQAGKGAAKMFYFFRML